MFYKNLTHASNAIKEFSFEHAMCSGNFSAIFKKSDTIVLIKTVEKEKIDFLSILFKENKIPLNIKDSEFDGIYEAEALRLHDDYLLEYDSYECVSNGYTDERDDIEKALSAVSDHYGSDIFTNTELYGAEKLPEDIFADWFDENDVTMSKIHNEYYEAIQESFSIIKKMNSVEIYIDLHMDQFMRIPSRDSGKLILIDAVIFGDNEINIL